MTEPTDGELDAVLCNQWPAFSMQATLVRVWVRAAMRDALEKWGTPPAVAGEQFKVVSKLGDNCLFHSSSVRKGDFVYTTPQPAQAGAVPLTCEWTHNDDDGFWETACGDAWRFDDGGPKENNMNFCHCCGKTLRIKGGQP